MTLQIFECAWHEDGLLRVVSPTYGPSPDFGLWFQANDVGNEEAVSVLLDRAAIVRLHAVLSQWLKERSAQ